MWNLVSWSGDDETLYETRLLSIPRVFSAVQSGVQSPCACILNVELRTGGACEVYWYFSSDFGVNENALQLQWSWWCDDDADGDDDGAIPKPTCTESVTFKVNFIYTISPLKVDGLLCSGWLVFYLSIHQLLWWWWLMEEELGYMLQQQFSYSNIWWGRSCDRFCWWFALLCCGCIIEAVKCFNYI